MGRRKKPLEAKRVDLASKVLPSLKADVYSLAQIHDKTKSSMVEALVIRGMQGFEDDKDELTRIMLELWRELRPEFRNHIIGVTKETLKLNAIASTQQSDYSNGRRK
jgi:SepF-like predicted cell division protein (DUF552 family)